MPHAAVLNPTRVLDVRKAVIAVAGVVIAFALVILAIAAVLPSSESESSGVAAAPAPAPVASVTSDGRNGAPLALVSGRPMFPLPGAAILSSWNNAPVMAQDVPVQSIVSTGFWMGPDEVQRVFVTIPTSVVEKGSLDLSALQVGERLNISGRMQALPENLRPLGLDDQGREQILRANQLLVANSVRRAA